MEASRKLSKVFRVKCIFCLKDKPPSEEHLFPLAIGGVFVIWRVCKGCNDQLGAGADASLTNHALCVVARDQLRIPDRNGNIPSFIQTYLREGVLVEQPDQKTRTVINQKTGQVEVRWVYHATSTSPQPDVEHKTITLDASEAHRIPTIIQRERARAKLPPLSDAELQVILSSVIEQQREIDHPAVKTTIPIDTVKFRRGLAKIAYEFSWFCLGDGYLDDPIAGELRDYILNGIEHPIEGVSMMEPIPGFEPWASDANNHLAFTVLDRKSVVVGVRVFSTFFSKIRVSQSAEHYPDFLPAGIFVVNDPVARSLRHSSFAAELQRAQAL